MLAVLLPTAVWAAPIQSGAPQTLASADAVPKGLSAPEWSSIRQQNEQQRHAAYPVAGGYQAHNPAQQWQTRFDGRGFTVQPAPDRDRSHSGASSAAWQWGLELQSYGFAGQERAVKDQPRVTYDWDATLQEWFVNDWRGLEHGFTVRERPLVRSAGFPTCCIADFLIGKLSDVAGSAGLETRDTAELEVCATADDGAGALQNAVVLSLNSFASTSHTDWLPRAGSFLSIPAFVLERDLHIFCRAGCAVGSPHLSARGEPLETGGGVEVIGVHAR